MTEILTGGSYMIGYVQFIKQPFAALVSLSLSLSIRLPYPSYGKFS